MFYEYNDSWDKLKRNRNQQNKNSSTDYTLKKYLIEATNMHSGTQKQPSRGVIWKRCSENMQLIYRRTPISTELLCNISWRYVGDISIFTHDCIISYDKFSDFDHALTADVDSPEYLQPLHKNLRFLPEKMIIKKQSKLACTFHNKRNYRYNIRLLQQTLKYGLIKKLRTKPYSLNETHVWSHILVWH